MRRVVLGLGLAVLFGAASVLGVEDEGAASQASPRAQASQAAPGARASQAAHEARASLTSHGARAARELGAHALQGSAGDARRLSSRERAASIGFARGVTLGPIESRLQPGRGYGSEPFAQTLDEVKKLGADWVSLTVFGRVWDLDSAGVELSFEAPFEETRDNVKRSVELAHARGLRVFLVPHLWVESGAWRAEIDPGSDAGWVKWSKSYQRFVSAWAEVAEEAGIDLFAAGVELRSWVTSARAPSFLPVLRAIRARYQGPVTYAANWDDAEDTVIWGELDLIGINAFYQLHWEDDATVEQLVAGGERVAEQVRALAARYDKPVLFTEFGYTARQNTAIKPWLWPEELGAVTIDQAAQEEAYAALLGAMTNVPGFAGMFVWRMYADVADLSQEPDWGFSPWGKRAERVLRDAFQARYAAERR